MDAFFDMFDGELVLVRGENIVHVFERDTFSRAAYDYMIDWVQRNTSPTDDPGTTWTRAEAAWDALSPEFQATLIQIANREKQNAQDIRDGLLATLHGYQGFSRVKDSFAHAIRLCFNQM